MPINGEIFLKKMDQFVESTDRHISTTEKLLKRMEDFFELEDEKKKDEKKFLDKRAYVKVKDPLEEISSKIGTSNILLQDILKAVQGKKGLSGGGFDFEKLKDFWPLLIAGAALLPAALELIKNWKQVKEDLNYVKDLFLNPPKSTKQQIREGLGDITKDQNKRLNYTPEELKRLEEINKRRSELAPKLYGQTGPRAFVSSLLTPYDYREKWGKFFGTVGNFAANVTTLGWREVAEVYGPKIRNYNFTKSQKEDAELQEEYNKILKNAIERTKKSKTYIPPKNPNAVIKRVSKFNSIINKYAKEFDVDPIFFSAMIAQESAGNPNVISSAGAKGLTQLMPNTGKDYGVIDPFDPDQNIKGGMIHFKKLLDRYKGDKEKALAAYNGGTVGVDAAVKNYGDNWLEHLHEFKGINSKTGKNHAEETIKHLQAVAFYEQLINQGQLKQKPILPKIEDVQTSEQIISQSMESLKDLLSGKNGGMTLSDSTLQKLGTIILKNIPVPQTGPNINYVDPRK